MPSLYNRITPQRVLIWSITAGGILLAPVLAYFVCTLGLPLVFIITGLIGVAGWSFIARDRWWVPFPAALALGGTFYYGFKIPAHEMALLVCLFPLMLALATRWQGAMPGRAYPPPSVFLLAAYLFFHWIGSLIYNRLEGMGGFGNVTRNYMNAFWPMILFFFYYFFGNSRHIRQAFFLMYIAYFVRVLISIGSYFSPVFMYIPGINFIPAGVATGGMDLRTACPSLATLSLCYFYLKKGTFLRIFNASILLISFPLALLSGGRLGFLGFLVLPIFWAFIYRKFLSLAILFFVIGSFLIALNVSRDALTGLPPKVQRTLSAFIINNPNESEDNALSNEYHARLQEEGRKRWLSSLTSIIIGNGVRPLNMEEWTSGSLDDMIKSATLNGNYESALWTLLVKFGLVGFLLYLNLLRYLIGESFPDLWKKKICDFQTAFTFMASYNIFIWLLLCPFAGGEPSLVIMFSLFAKTLRDDQRQELAEEADAEALSPSPTPA